MKLKWWIVLLCLAAFAAGLIIGLSMRKEEVRYIEKSVYIDELPDYIIESLKAKLKSDEPLSVIKADLQSKPELIPYKAELGGTLGFYDPGGIRVLNDKWVIASFEDGHIGGYLFLRYTIEEGANIKWEVIDSFLY